MYLTAGKPWVATSFWKKIQKNSPPKKILKKHTRPTNEEEKPNYGQYGESQSTRCARCRHSLCLKIARLRRTVIVCIRLIRQPASPTREPPRCCNGEVDDHRGRLSMAMGAPCLLWLRYPEAAMPGVLRDGRPCVWCVVQIMLIHARAHAHAHACVHTHVEAPMGTRDADAYPGLDDALLPLPAWATMAPRAGRWPRGLPNTQAELVNAWDALLQHAPRSCQLIIEETGYGVMSRSPCWPRGSTRWDASLVS